MGSASSIVDKIENDQSCSKDCITFLECFEGLIGTDKKSKAARVQGWRALDNNGNGHVSLAETGKWIQDSLINYTESKETGTRIYKAFYRSYIRAFKDAADASADKAIKGGKKKLSTDDYVQKVEFRLLNAYLCIYAMMFDHFSLLDGGTGGIDKNDDRKISPDELKKGAGKFKKSPFVATKILALGKESLDTAFKQMDADGKGAVLLVEFCNWVKAAEIELDTPFGKLLIIDVDAQLESKSSD